MDGWFVARTQPHRERWAGENIVRQEAEFYAPRIAEFIRIRGAQALRARFLFPSYVFVRSASGQWRFLLGTFGVTGVIMQGNVPAIMPNKEVVRLRAMEDDEGFVQLPNRLRSGLQPNDPVRVSKGLFEGYTGIYQGSGPQERERVLLDYLGRKTSVLIAVGNLELVNAG